jgi:hypothetical protein
MKKNNDIIFSEYFMRRRIIDEGKIYNNEIVRECCECSGMGIITETYPETMCAALSNYFIVIYFPFINNSSSHKIFRKNDIIIFFHFF